MAQGTTLRKFFDLLPFRNIRPVRAGPHFTPAGYIHNIIIHSDLI
jgi:hypothetical protein